MQLRQPRLKSGAWERLRGVLMEKTGSNMEEEGRGAESNHGQGGKQGRSKLKSKSRESLERTQSQRFDMIKGAGSAARRATLQLNVQSGEGQLSLFGVSTITTRGNFSQNLAKPSNCYPRLYGRLLISRFRRRPGSSFPPTLKVSRRTEWSQRPIG